MKPVTNSKIKNSKPTSKPFRILSLDGGGVRALVQAVILKRLSDEYPSLLDNIDMIAGTSAGSIMALSIACDLTPQQIIELWMRDAGKIFTQSMWNKMATLDNVMGACYKQDEMRKMLEETAGTRKLSDLKKKVLIPAFNLDPIDRSAGRTQNDGSVTETVINADPAHQLADSHKQEEEALGAQKEKKVENKRWIPEYFHNLPGSTNADETLVDICLRSSAAPTYFPIYQGYCDGGTFANNPAMAAVSTAICAGINIEDISVLSISTGNNPKYISKEEYKTGNWGLYEWGFQIIDLLLDSTTSAVSHNCKCLLNQRYHRLDPMLQDRIGLDQAAPDALKKLTDTALHIDLKPTMQWIESYWKIERNPSVAEDDWIVIDNDEQEISVDIDHSQHSETDPSHWNCTIQ